MMTPNEIAIEQGRGDIAFEVNQEGGGIHRHAFRVKRIKWPDHDGYYLEFEEPGACGCVRRVDLAVLTHALLNMSQKEIDAMEDRAVCAQCAHNHHLDDVGYEE